jgi:hypothetical protein
MENVVKRLQEKMCRKHHAVFSGLVRVMIHASESECLAVERTLESQRHHQVNSLHLYSVQESSR